MKVVILAGGLGTRLSEETHLRPKPMVEIGGRPILWHIMKQYSHYGLTDFVICVGYKGYMIKEYFANYAIHTSDVTFDFAENSMTYHHSYSEPWKVTVIDTGEQALTGARIRHIAPYVENQPFCLTYGDGVSDVPIDTLLAFHQQHGKTATVTAVRPLGRFGTLEMNNNDVTGFTEKPLGDGQWINGGFFVCNPSVFNYITEPNPAWETGPLQALTQANELAAYKHNGFWQPMDTLRDRHRLEELWASGTAPWKLWQDKPPFQRQAPISNGMAVLSENKAAAPVVHPLSPLEDDPPLVLPPGMNRNLMKGLVTRGD